MARTKILWMALTAILLSSCGIFNRKTTSIQKEKIGYSLSTETVKTSQEAGSTGVTQQDLTTDKSKVQETEYDKSKIVTEITETTTNKKPGVKSNFEADKKDLLKAEGVRMVDSFGNVIVAKFDSLGDKLSFNLETAPIDQINTKTTKITNNVDKGSARDENKDINSSSDKEEQNQYNRTNKEATARDEDYEESKTDKVVIKEPVNVGKIAIQAGLALLVLFGVWQLVIWVKNKYFKK